MLTVMTSPMHSSIRRHNSVFAVLEAS
jgi:hypothetical protein